MTLRIGCSTGAFFPGAATEAAIGQAARLGLSDIEVMLQAHHEYQPTFFEMLREQVQTTGVSVHAVHALHRYHPVFDSYLRRVEEGWELFERAVEGAALLGARVLVWHGACKGNRGLAAHSNKVLEAVDRLAGICSAHEVKLALENVSWCAMAQTRDVLALASRIPVLRHADAVGFAFDPFQASEANANPFMILAAMENRLLDVHLRDFRESEPSNRGLLPGDGDLPWPALVRAIASAGYDDPLILEGSFGAKAKEEVDGVRRLLEPLIDSATDSGELCDGPLPSGVLKGIRLFNAGEFYECHEVIEHEWHAERGSIRQLYQGILQIGVGFHHAKGGNQRGAILLLTDGITKVSAFLPSCRGIDTADLVAASRACLIAIEKGSDSLDAFDWNTLPTVKTHENESEGASKRPCS